MNLTMALTIEERLKKELDDYMGKNPMPELKHRKMFYIKHIDDKINAYHEGFLKDKRQLEMTEEEIGNTIEYVKLKMMINMQDI